MHNKTNYNPKIHHRRSIRLKGYDYSKAGLYFITICCQDRNCIFGNIINGEMVLNEFGQIAFDEWMNTPKLRPNVELGEFVVMPNHIHGIIRLMDMDENEITDRGELHSPQFENSPKNENLMGEYDSPRRENELLYSPENELLEGEYDSPQQPENENLMGEYDSPRRDEFDITDMGEFDSPQRFRSPSKTVGAIVRGFKSSVTKQLNLLNIGHQVWQRNYYEHIIRNEKAHQNIAVYIRNNPSKWTGDKFYLKK